MIETTMNPDIKKQWVDALRSGEYRQGHSSLRPLDGSYCCLGVLCDIYAKTTGKGKWEYRDEDWTCALFHADDTSQDCYPPPSVMHWAGIEDVPDDADIVINKLIDMNDDDQASFNRISNYIERTL
jgi:hypothetical protein